MKMEVLNPDVAAVGKVEHPGAFNLFALIEATREDFFFIEIRPVSFNDTVPGERNVFRVCSCE